MHLNVHLQMWHIYRMKYYTSIKNEIMPVAATQRYLEIIILTEVKQRQIYHIYIILKKKIQTNSLQNKNRL